MTVLMTTKLPLAGRPGFLTARAAVTVIAVITFFGMLLAPQPLRIVCGVTFFTAIVLLAVLTWMHVFYLRHVIREQREGKAADERTGS